MKKEKVQSVENNEVVDEKVSVDKTEKVVATKQKESTKSSTTTSTHERILSIDRFRGICMFLMVCSFILPLFGAFEFLAPYMEHANKEGIGGFQILPGVAFADLFAAMFIFVIGLTTVKSFKSREAKVGTKRAYWQFALRGLSLIGIGCLLNGMEDGWGSIIEGSTFQDLRLNEKIFAVLFVVALAVVLFSIVVSFIKNEKLQKIARAIVTYFLAACGLIGLYSLCCSMGAQYPGAPADRFGGWMWDTLQNIGLSILIALPFIKFDKWGKLVIVGVSFVVITIMEQNGLLDYAGKIIEGGFVGAFSWAGILLLGSIFAELKDENRYWILASLLLLVSVVLIVAYDVAARKRGCTPVYATFCASVSAIVWGLLNYLNNWKPRFDFFAVWGSNPILTYVVNYAVALFAGLLIGDALLGLNIWAALAVAVLILAVFTVGNWLLKRYNKYIRL